MLHSSMTSAPGNESDDHKVYVIDDEPSLRESSCFLLATLGLACVQYPGGREFLADVERLEPGCILLDVSMDEMNGLEVQRELLRRSIDWPIILMSGHGDVPTVVEGVKKGAVEFLEKPFTEEQLLTALHRGFVRLRQAAGGSG